MSFDQWTILLGNLATVVSEINHTLRQRAVWIVKCFDRQLTIFTDTGCCRTLTRGAFQPGTTAVFNCNVTTLVFAG